MKKLLLIAGVGAGAIAIYLIATRGKDKKVVAGCGCTDVIDARNVDQLYPDAALEQYDASWGAISPSTYTAIGSYALKPENGEWK